MSIIMSYWPVIAAAVVFFLAGWLLTKTSFEKKHGQAKDFHDRLIDDARREASDIVKSAELEAKEEYFQARQKFEEETETTRKENRRRHDALDQREDNLNRKVSFIDKKEHRLDESEAEIKKRQKVLDDSEQSMKSALDEQQLKLEQIAGLSAEKARNILMEKMVSDARLSAAKTIKQVREETERNSRRESMKILSLAVQRYAAEHVAENTVSVVDLPSDEMKGRIIGREGRNIRSFELATGIDLIIDDTPGAANEAGVEPVRREEARQSLEILIRDGRIHPGRIEEVVRKTSEEMNVRIKEIGEQAVLDLGLPNIHNEMYYYIGRLSYRTSYGQNLLKHSMEVAAVSSVIASELGLDPRLAKRCGFLHDLGKAADHEIEGPHAIIGARLCKKFGENETVLNAVAGHHSDVEATTPYTFLVSAADAVSASRPGARRESVQNYVERLENLEMIADGFDGVEKSFAIQAGREIRVLVNHNLVSDAEAAALAEEVSRRIEGELEYPGQIKVMVIRETRATSIAH